MPKFLLFHVASHYYSYEVIREGYAMLITRTRLAGAEKSLRFVVYLSPKDETTVCGYMENVCAISPDNRNVTWYSQQFGIPVAEAFERTIAFARSVGARNIYVDDPVNLFPDAELRLR